MNRSLSTTVLQQQNVTFKGTGGVSQENQSCGFAPAFYDTRSRVADISRFANGMPAPVHLLDGVPEEWVMERDSTGKVTALRESVIAGFVRSGRFYTRAQAASLATN